MSKCCPPAPGCQCVIVQSLPVGMNALRPLYAQIVNEIPITFDIGTSCENPIYANICNDIPISLDIGTSCENPIYTTVCELPELFASVQVINSSEVPIPVYFPAGAISATVNVDELGGNPIDLGAGIIGAGTQRFVLASDNFPTIRIDQSSEGVFNRVCSNTYQVGGNLTAVGNGLTTSGTQRVTLSSDSTGQVNLASGAQVEILAAGGATLNSTGNALNVNIASTAAISIPTNVEEWNGVTVVTGNGNAGAGVLRVTLADNSTGQVTLAAGVATIGALIANQSVNLTAINGTAPDVNNGSTNSGTFRVTMADNSTGVLASITALNLAQGSTTGPQTGPLIQGAVTTAFPGYVHGQTSPLSLNTSGQLRVEASVSFPTTQDINLLEVGGTPVAVSNGGTTAGTQRVTIANDSTGMLSSVTTLGTITNALPTGANILGRVGINQTSPGSSNAVSLSYVGVGNPIVETGTAGIMIMGIADGFTGSAFVCAVDGLNGTGTSVQAVQNVIQYNDVAPTAITESRFGNMRGSSTGVAYSQIRDAAGNERGANVDASNRLSVSVDAITATNSSVNVAQISGTATSVNNGAVDNGTQRVTIANNSTGILAGVTTVSTVTAVTAITNALPAGTNAIGVVSTKTALTASSPTAASVGVASAAAVSAAATRKGLILTNTSSATISLAFGVAAVLNSGITLPPGAWWQMDECCFSTAEVRAIASAAASNLSIQEFTT